MDYIITKIEPQKKRKNRYSLFHNKDFITGVSEKNLLEFELVVGSEITDDLLSKIVDEEETDYIYNSAIKFLARRQHSIKELKQKLLRKTKSERIISIVIKSLLEKGYLNDKDFAHAYTKEELNLKKSGPLLIKKKLIQKGIRLELIDELLTITYLPELQTSNCKKLAEKKISTINNHQPIKQKKVKLVNYLKQKGYDWETCEQVINSLKFGENDE